MTREEYNTNLTVLIVSALIMLVTEKVGSIAGEKLFKQFEELTKHYDKRD